MRCVTLVRALVLSLVGAGASAPRPVVAQSSASGNGSSSVAMPAASATIPGRAPNQPIDEEYTKKIQEYTTEPFFLSPLVDYLPASKTVPTPKVVLGDIAGAPNKLPYSSEVYDYMRRLAKATPRVKVFSIGTTEEGREMIAVAVASEALMAKLEENKAKLARLADPRTINMNDAEAARLANDAAPVYYITGTIHSPESGAPTALMELAYRLAVDESPYIRNIRDHLITLITPIVEVDGRDRQVDLFKWHMAHPDETWPSLIYWGHYVAHDNNRDAMGLTLKLSQNVLNTYVDWKAQVLHDLHESVAYLYDNTIGDGPYNAWLDPLLTNEWQMIGWNNVQEMTRFGMPGVFAYGDFDTWSPGYLMFMAATHNGISRLYETFGNGGSAETLERTLSPNETAAHLVQAESAAAARDVVAAQQQQLRADGPARLAHLHRQQPAALPRNFYEKSKRSILKAQTEGPAAYVLPADDPRLGAQAQLLRVLQMQARGNLARDRAVHGSGACAPARDRWPRRPGRRRGGAGGGRRGGGRGDRGRTRRRGADTTRTMAHEFPAGSYIIRMDQPYSRIADALLDYQYWSPNDPQKNPYDDTGLDLPRRLRRAGRAGHRPEGARRPHGTRQGDGPAPGGVTGSGSVFVDQPQRRQCACHPALPSQGRRLPGGRGTVRGRRTEVQPWLVHHSQRVAGRSRQGKPRRSASRRFALASAPSVRMHPARAARVAILHTWTGTQTEGWWREAFDVLPIPYDYISVQDVAKTPP